MNGGSLETPFGFYTSKDKARWHLLVIRCSAHDFAVDGAFVGVTIYRFVGVSRSFKGKVVRNVEHSRQTKVDKGKEMVFEI